MIKRIISLIMSISIVLSMLPLQAMATEPVQPETIELVETTIPTSEAPLPETTVPGETEEVPTETTELEPVEETTLPEPVQVETAAAEAVEAEASEYSYTVLNGTYCEVTGYTGEETEISIPSELDGYIVQSIGNGAFKNNKTLTAISFPETVETMGTEVFNGCTSLTDVRLNEGLTLIPERTFAGCAALESISLPASVASIGKYAFSCCSSLSEITLSEGLTSVYPYAFENCSALESIVLPDSITSLGSRAFYSCINLAEVNYPAGWTTVLDYNYNSSSTASDGSSYYQSPFQGCSALTSIEIPEGVTSIPKYAFRSLDSLVDISLPSTLTSVKGYAFDATGILSLTMPDSLTSVGSYAFAACKSLKEVEFSSSLTAIGSHAFEASTALAEVLLPQSLTSLGDRAFYQCTGLAKVTISEGLTQLNVYTFSGCTSLEEVSLPDSLTTIYPYAFENCSALESIHIPDSVASIGSRAFYNCTKLADVNYPAGWTTVLDYNYNSSTSASFGSSYYQSPFQGCSALISMEIPEGVTEIPSYAFRNAAGLTSVELPSTLTTVGAYAFDLAGLKSLTMPDSLTTIGSYGFASCTGLKAVTFSKNLSSVGTCGFAYNTGLTQVTLSGSLTSLGSNAFEGCTGLRKITIEEGLTTLNTKTFCNCTGLTEISLPSSLTAIYPYAFENCSSLESVAIPESVTTLGARTFYNCTRLSELGYPTGWTTVLDYNHNSSTSASNGSSYYQSPFQGCSSLTLVEIPEGVASIPKYAFRGVTDLEEIVLSSTVTTIEGYAFDGCSGLEKIWIGENVATIGSSAFGSCSNLTIHGVEGSYAQTYAESNSIPFSTELMVYPTGSIAGVVETSAGIGISGVTVTLYDQTWGEELDTLSTGSDGSWRCDEVIIGHTYRILFYHPDYTLTNSSQTVTIGEDPLTAETVIAQAKAQIPEADTADFTYSVLNGTYCKVTGYTGEETEISIPSGLDGYIVQSIGNGAFKNNKTLTAVSFPETVETMGTEVFNGCTSLTDVRLNEGLTVIPERTFAGCTALESITLPASVASIGKYAFSCCSSLSEIALSEGLKSVYPYAFENCSALESIILPDSITSLGSRAFYSCTNLAEVNYPIGWTTVLDYNYNSSSTASDGSSYYQSPFQGCTALTSITVPEGVTAIPKYAFRSLSSLVEVSLPSSLTSVKGYAFDATGILSLTMPDSLTSVGSYSFAACKSLKEVKFSSSLATIGSHAFEASTALAEVVLPQSLTSLGDRAFYQCTGLAKVTVSEGLTQLNVYTFSGCTSLEEVSLPDSLTTIYPYAFENCSALESIHIPDSVASIGARAFYNCSALSEVNYPAGWTAVLDYNYNSSTSASFGSSYYQSPFQGCSALTSITIPEGVTEIPNYAFRNASALAEVSLPSTLTTVGAYAFDLAGLKSLTMPDSLTTIGSYGFASCTGLKAVTFSKNLSSVGTYGFAYNTGLTQVTLPGSLTSLGSNAFEGCTGLRKVTIEEGLTTLNTKTFCNCTGLTEVTLPDSLVTIYPYAFENCSSLESIDIPESVTTLGARAFYTCSRLSELGYPTGWTTVLDYNHNSSTSASNGSSYYQSPFQGCSSLTLVEIPEGVTAIPKYAFRGVTDLEEIVLSSTVTTIEGYAFDGCSGLEKIWIGENVATIGSGAFGSCSNLTIHGVEGSYAQTYAESNSIPFSTELMVYPTGSIAGVVETSAGIGISGVTVTLYDQTWGEELDTLTTGSDGSWRCEDVIIGHTYRILFYHPDYTLTNSSQTVTIGEEPLTAETVIAQAKTQIPETDTADFTYSVLNGTYCKVTGYTGEETEISIPSELDGYIVQSIGNGAFKNNKTLTAVSFPETVETMGSEVFNGCTALTDVRLNEGLTVIPERTFAGCTALESITLPASVASIGKYAFSCCSSLSEITLSEGLKSVYPYAFENCSALESLTIPDSVASLGARAFYNCSALSEVNYPAGWTTVLDYNYNSTSSASDGSSYYQSPFQGCTALTSITVPEGVTAIPKYAFRSLSSLVEVSLPSSLTSVKGYAFDATGIQSLTMPDSLTSIGSYAFAACKSLKDVAFSSALATIGSHAFEASTALAEVILPESLTSLGDWAFHNCTGLKTVTVSEGLEALNVYTFSGCSSLEEINLPDSLTTIYPYAFENCSALESIHIPDSVASIGARAFYNCSALSEVNYPAGWTAVLDYNYNSSSSASFGSSYYQSPFQGCSALTSITIPEGVTEIPNYAFRNAAGLTSVELPSTLTTVGAYAFDLAGLKSLTMPDSLTTIGSYGFASCTGLKSVTFSQNLESVGTYGFAYNTGLTQVTLPGSLTSLGSNAFEGCTGLRKITIEEGLTTLNTKTFCNCTGLTEISLPSSLTAIYPYAFENCSSLESVAIPESVTTLGARAFHNCTRLSELGYPTGWTTVLDYNHNSSTSASNGSSYYQSPFQGCSSLTLVEIPEGVASIPKYAFRGVTGLQEVRFPSTLKTIGEYAFEDCTGLRIVEFNEGLTAIPSYCFRNCTALAVAEIPSTVASIGSYAFCNCLGLRVVNLGSGVASIGESAFYGCDGLVSLVLNDGLTSIGKNSFGDCANLQSVEVPASVQTLDKTSFSDCGKLTVYCYSGTQAHMVGEAAGVTLYILDEHEHLFRSEVETEPSCTRDGSQIRICELCNYYCIDILKAPGHTEMGWTALNKPSCTTEGIRIQTCSVCGEEIARDYIPAYDHMEADWVVSDGNCIDGGYKTKSCTICGAELERVLIPAVGHQWSEWIVESEPSVLCEGVTYRTCSVCQDREEILQEKLTVDISKDTGYGLVHLTIVNATTLEPISGASVFISTEEDGEATLSTDGKGKLSQILPVGPVTLSVFANGYQTRTITITVEPGETELPSLGISDGYLVEGQLTAEEMTYEEMLAAGIDVNDPSNQHLYKYALVLEFAPEIDWLSILFYMGGDGLPYVTGGTGPNGPGGGGGADDDSGGGGVGPWHIIYDNGGNGKRGIGLWGYLPDGQKVSVYPVNERFYLIIYGEVHWVKEMYHVELLTINHSKTDTVENAEAELYLPEGLSLAKMVGKQQTLKQEIGSLGSGESKSVHWYVRGDKAGTYSISAALRGHMLPFGDYFEYVYEAQDPIKVYAGSAMHLTFHVPDSAFTGEPYTVRIELENVSDKVLYNVTHAITDIDQYRVTEYSDGMIEIEEYPVEGGTGSIFIPEFRPGDVIVIETTTTIMFESKLIEYQKDQAKKLLGAVQGLMQGFKAFETGVSLIGTMTDWLGNATSAVNDYLDEIVVTAAEKAKLVASLAKQLKELADEFSGEPTAGMTKKIQELKSSGVWDEVQAFIDDPSVLETYSGKDLAKLACKIGAAKAQEAPEFDPYDAVRNLIDMIPVRFRLVDAWVATLEESTTVIPSTIVVVPVGPHYFGVENVSRYISTLLKLYMADVVADALPIDILGDKFKEDIGYADDLEYVRTVENQASQYKITGTGGSGFRAWIERAEVSTYSRSAAPNFELAIDNGTGVLDENGVLSFTGSGTLSVTPRSQVPGVLCVEMEDGTVKRYTLDVVEEHTCGSENWTVIYAPSEDLEGLKVQYCDVCGEIVDMASMTACSDHAFGDYVLVLEPTVEAAGKEVRTCSHCGAEDYRYTDALSAGSYLEVTASKTELAPGETASLTAQILPEGSLEAEILWTLAEGHETYATLTANGAAATITAASLTEMREVTVIARTKEDLAEAGSITLRVCPRADAVFLFSGEENVTGKTLSFDLNGKTKTLTLTAQAAPDDAKQTFLWTSANEKIATVKDGVLTFTGTDGKVKITATAQDGSKQSASVTLQTVRIPHNLRQEDEVKGEAHFALVGGKSRNLVVYNKDTGKALTAKQISWSIPEQYAAFASVNTKGKLSTKKVVALARIEVIGTITGSSDDPVVYVVDIYPAVTHAEILKDGQVVNGQTLLMKEKTMTLSAALWPSDAMAGVTWSNPDASKQAYARYRYDQAGNLVISNPTGKAGTLTLKATAKDGSKKTATVKIRFGILADSLTITQPPALTLRSGSTLTLTASVSPAKVSSPGILWSLEDKADSAYVSLSKGKVKAKTVQEARYVTINAVTKDGNASDSITLLILPKAEQQLILKSGEDHLTKRTVPLNTSGGGQMTLSAFMLTAPDDGSITETPEKVTWASSRPDVVSLSAGTGESVTAKARNSGTAVITAKTANGQTATVTLKCSVLVDTLSITVKETKNLTKNGIEVVSGKAVTLQARTNGNAASKKVTWSILSGEEYGKLTSSGKLTAAKNLTSVQTILVEAAAADGSGKTATATVTVRPIAQGLQVYTVENGVQTFTVRSDDSVWVRNSTTAQWDLTTQGSTICLNADVYPFYGDDHNRNAQQQVSWKSSSPKVADFKRDQKGQPVLDANGNVQLVCKGTGKTTITVTAEDGSKKKVSFKLTVVKNVSDLHLDPQTLVSKKSLNLAKLLKVSPTGTTTKKFSWSISGSGAAYATISSSGVLKAKAVPSHQQVAVTVTAKDSLGYSETFLIDLYPTAAKTRLVP